MISPSLDMFEKMVEERLQGGVGGKVLAVFTLDMEGDEHTPISIFKKLCAKGQPSYMLESAEKGRLGRNSYIGRKPFIQIRAYGERVEIEQGGQTCIVHEKPLLAMRKAIGQYELVGTKDSCEFAGGAVGYMAYDFVRTCEKLGEANYDDFEMPDVHMMIAGEMVAYDHVKQSIRIILNVQVDADQDIKKVHKKARERLEQIRDEIRMPAMCSGNEEGKGAMFECSFGESRESFIGKVEKAKEYIRNGDIFQVVLSQRLDVKTNMEALDVYRTLRTLNPSPYMYYIEYGDYQVAGSSPELLVKLTGEEVETCPIAGTRPRGSSEEEDEKYSVELLNDKKERAEHMMLVDLARNDIGRISKFNSVELTNFMEVQKYSHVMHIVSNVTGKARDGHDMFDALGACMPAGTVSGAPKVRAMQIIDELEDRKRGVYAGAIGYFGFNGNMDMCIAIRTVVFKDGTAHIQAGAGIVADSDPLCEYNETLGKAQALVEALKNTRRDMK